MTTHLTARSIIRRIVEALNPAAANASKLSFSAILSPSQIQKDINVSMSALTMVFQCLDVPQVPPPCLALH